MSLTLGPVRSVGVVDLPYLRPYYLYPCPGRSDGLRKDLGPPTNVPPLVLPLPGAVLKRASTSPSTDQSASQLFDDEKLTMADKGTSLSGKRVPDGRSAPHPTQ